MSYLESKLLIACLPFGVGRARLGELQRLDGFAQNGSAPFQRFLLDRFQRQWNGAQHALTTHQMRQAKSHAFATSDALDAAANRKYSPLVIEQHIHDARHGATDAILCGAFAGQDGIPRTPDLLVDLPLFRIRYDGGSAHASKLLQRHSHNRRQ